MTINSEEILMALLGGVLIGLSVTLMLLFKGRVTGISGIAYGFINLSKNDWIWRGFFIFGLVAGGFILSLNYPSTLENSLDFGYLQLIVAGLFVGYGTVLGNGCTSGHGVCGISRFSLRSIVATGTFMAFGMIAVALVSYFFLGGQ